MEVVAGPRATGARGPLLLSRNRLRHGEIVRRRHLDVGRLAFDEPHRMTGPFGERGLVGRFGSALAKRERFTQDTRA